MRFATKLIQHGRVRQCQGTAIWVGQLLGERQRLLDVLPRLVRVAEMPAGMGRKAMKDHAEVTGKSSQTVMLTSIVQSDALFQMLTRRRELPVEEPGLPERPVRA